MKISHCIHCGTESEATWRFCRRCGTALENLEALAKSAQCANCSTPLADGWRFCPNCGTGTDSAAPMAAGGLTPDEVAELIAKPAAVAERTEPAERPETVAPHTIPEVVEELAGSADPIASHEEVSAPARDGAGSGDPVVSAPKITFEPTSQQPTTAAVSTPILETAPVPRDLDMMTAPPAPPADPSLPDVAELAAGRATEAPPPPPVGAARPDFTQEEPAVPTSDADRDVPASAAVIDIMPTPVVEESDPFAAQPGPAVIIPPAADKAELHIPKPPADSPRPAMRAELPRPIGTPHEQSKTSIPRPLDVATRDQAPAEEAPRHRELLTTPSVAIEGLPPIDGRRFTNPGLLGQVVQLAMLIAAAFTVAMVVAFTVLNNRLDAYATTGESLARVESAQTIINNWMRPILVIALLTAYTIAVLWARRVLRNISVFDKFVPETALWMWVIPGANIFALWQHLELAWKGSDFLTKDDPDWRKGPSNWWSFAFALLAIIAFGVILYAWLFMSGETFENAIDANAVSIIGYGLVITSLLCGVRAVGAVVERQQKRVQQYD